MTTFLRALLGAHVRPREERGASAAEYSLLIAGIAALIAVVLFAFSGTIASL